ncbi:unnamed protein product [Urochloa humidicola]
MSSHPIPMAKEKRQRRRRTSIQDISYDTLEVILQHLPSPVVLVRAAATCKLWRRVVGDAGFLRRFRRRNGPYVLGHYHPYFGGRVDFVPLPAPEMEIGIASISDRVSLDFLSRPFRHDHNTVLHDSRDGLLAFCHIDSTINVCCPLTKKQKVLFPISTTPALAGKLETQEILGAFFIDPDPDEGLNMSNFRILRVQLRQCLHDSSSKTVEAFIFSASRDDHRWHQLGSMAIGDDIIPYMMWPRLTQFVGRAGSSIFWCEVRANVVLHLDESTSEFSCFTLPGGTAGICRKQLYSHDHDMWSLRVIGGNTGSVRLLRIAGDVLEVLCHDRGSGTCRVERRVRVSRVASREGELRQYRRWYFSDDTSDEAARCSWAHCAV